MTPALCVLLCLSFPSHFPFSTPLPSPPHLTLPLHIPLFPSTPPLPLLTGSTNNEEKERVEKFEGEEAMLERYVVHMALQEKLRELGGRGILEDAFEGLDLVKDNKWVCAV